MTTRREYIARELARAVRVEHMLAVAELERVARRLRELGEIKWSDVYESRARDLALQSARHLREIVARGASKARKP